MKPILLLGPALDGLPPLERGHVDVCRIAPGEEAVATADYSAVVVLNDGGADAVRRLLMALAMHKQRRTPRVGVLTYLGEADKRLPGLINLEPRLRLELVEEAIRLEYQLPGSGEEAR